LCVSLKSILVSSPVAAISGALPVAAFAIVNSFTADAVVVNIISSLPLLSLISSMMGAVKVGVNVAPLAIVTVSPDFHQDVSVVPDCGMTLSTSN
jgi:hypothetical protein